MTREHTVVPVVPALEAQVAEALRERDDWHTAADKWRERAIESEFSRREALDLLGPRIKECDDYQARVISLEREVERLERQRDEARDQVRALEIEHHVATAPGYYGEPDPDMPTLIDRLRRERDEARALAIDLYRAWQQGAGSKATSARLTKRMAALKATQTPYPQENRHDLP